jgi:hypothetical protein
MSRFQVYRDEQITKVLKSGQPVTITWPVLVAETTTREAAKAAARLLGTKLIWEASNPIPGLLAGGPFYTP